MVTNNGHILVLFLGFLFNYSKQKAFYFMKIIQFSLMHKAMQYMPFLKNAIEIISEKNDGKSGFGPILPLRLTLCLWKNT